MASDNYQAITTLGQPSPLMAPGDPPYSSSYELYPGFWYTIDADFIISECIWDIEPYEGDDDLDGLDLHAFVYENFDESDLSAFAWEFGRNDCRQ